MTDQQPRPIWTTLSRPFTTGFGLALGGLVAFALGVVISNLATVLISIGFALFAALGLDPVVRWFEARKMKRGWAIVVVSALFALAVVGVLMLIIPPLVQQLTQFVTGIPHMLQEFQSSAVYDWLQRNLGDQASAALSDVKTFLTQPAHLATIGMGVLQVGASIATAISGTIIVLVLSLYFLASLPTIKLAFNRLIAARNRAKAAQMTDQITDSVGGYLMGMVLLAFCNALVAFILHLAVQLPYPMLMAVLAFCLTLIPLVGSVLYWAVATSLALFSGWLPALIFAAVYLIYMQIEAYVLTPRVMSRAISVPGALVVIGALIGGTLLGLLGALIAIPVTASLLLIAKQVLIPKQDAKV